MSLPIDGPILLTGSTGLLGSAFRRAVTDLPLICPTRDDINARQPGRIGQFVGDHRPSIVINCAADVRADLAEVDPEPAYWANTRMPAELAEACRAASIKLIHFSSTGCYGDWKSQPYNDEDFARPTTVHHQSKLRGEQLVEESGCVATIIRTGWLFGGDATQPRNFVWRRIEEAKGVTRLRSDNTQRGNPTFVDDLINQTFVMVAHGLRGTFNAVGTGIATRFSYVSRIVQFAGLPCVVEPVDTPFVRAAPVSPNEAAINGRLVRLGLDRMRPWEVALQDYIAQERSKPSWPTLEEL